MAIKLNKDELIFSPRQKLNSLSALNFVLNPTKDYTQELTTYIKNVPENFASKQLYLDILPTYQGGSTITKTLNMGANDGLVIMVFLASDISAIDLSDCDCREFIIRAGSNQVVVYGKITIENYDSYTPPTPTPVTPTNYFIHLGTEGAQFNITLADGLTYRNVTVLRTSDGQDITSGVTINLSNNLIQVDLTSDFACVVVYTI